ncbi:unnamed protein product [Heterobilharzia americana]|nr:unnamed protein product [Heterobilharzia americana]
MNLCDLENMHTQMDCYKINQLATTQHTSSFPDQLKIEELNDHPGTDYYNSHHNSLFTDNIRTTFIPVNTSTTTIPNSYSHEVNSSNNINHNILYNMKQCEKHGNNYQEVTSNYSYVDNEVVWTKNVFNSKSCLKNSVSLINSYNHSVKLNRNSINRESNSNEDYSHPNYHYDVDLVSTPGHMYSLTDYSEVNSGDYPYFVNDEQQVCLNEPLLSNGLEYSDFCKEFYTDRESNMTNCSHNSACEQDGSCPSELKINPPANHYSDQDCTPQRVVKRDLKPCDFISQTDSMTSERLEGQGGVHSSTNWSFGWSNDRELDSQTSNHLCSPKNITVDSGNYQIPNCITHTKAKDLIYEKEYVTNENDQSINQSYKQSTSLSNGQKACMISGLCTEVDHSYSPQPESKQSCSLSSSGAYFWLYNSQCKGPKASPLLNLTSAVTENNLYENNQERGVNKGAPSIYQDDFMSLSTSSFVTQPVIHYPISPLSLPGYPLVVFEDPVQRRFDLVHCSKLRRGDGNDVTPNLMRLRSMGEELAHLNRHITAQGELISHGAMVTLERANVNTNLKVIQGLSECVSNSKIVEQAKREKNKLASKICRLKKKAFHEANKIKYLGLEIEYNELATVIVKLRELITQSLRNRLPAENLHYEPVIKHMKNTEGETIKHGDHLPSLLSSQVKNLFGRKHSLSIAQDIIYLYSASSRSLLRQATDFYESTHMTRTAGRMDMLVDEVIRNYTISCSSSSVGSNYLQGGNNSLSLNRRLSTPLVQALTTSNTYFTSQDEEKSLDTRSSSTIFYESSEFAKQNNYKQEDHQCAPASKVNYPGPPPEFKLIYK